MKEFQANTYLPTRLGLPQEALAELHRRCRVMEVRKGDFLLTEGQRCRHSFLIERGLLRQYSTDDKGKEHLLLFAAEGWFLTNVEGVHFDLPSSYTVQALEETRALLIDEALLTKMSASHPAFARFNREMLHEHLLRQQRRITQLLSDSAEQRYAAFTEDYPEMSLRVPQAMIASYLGITPESLSRIRRTIAGKNSPKARSRFLP